MHHRVAVKLLQKQKVSKSLSSFTLSRNFTSADNILNSDLPNVTIPTGQIAPFIAQKTLQYSGAVAMEDGITGETLTYEELIDKVDHTMNEKKADLIYIQNDSTFCHHYLYAQHSLIM